MWESSTYILGWHDVRQFGKSLMQIKNKKGPRISPCGTPHLSKQILEREPLTRHRCVQLVKYDLFILFHFILLALP